MLKYEVILSGKNLRKFRTEFLPPADLEDRVSYPVVYFQNPENFTGLRT